MAKRTIDRLTKKLIRTAADERAVREGCRYVPEAAEHIVEFFRQFLRHSTGQWAGEPFELLDWQADGLLRPLFGWLRPDGLRRFRRSGIWISKKNGKSTLASGLSLYMLLADGEPGAEVYSAAGDRDQASIVYNEAKNMVKASEFLSNRLEVLDYKKRIVDHKTNSFYQVLSAEVPTKEGLKTSALVFDELHAQKTRDLFDTLRYGMAARRQPLLATISTAGYDRMSIGYEEYQYACQIRDSVLDDPTFYPFIAEALPTDDWSDEKVWHKANPSLGVTIDLGQFRLDWEEAKSVPTKENTFRRYRLNQWTEQETRWIPVDRWDECGGSDFDWSSLQGQKCWAGLDLSATTDITALVLLFRVGSLYVARPTFWVPEENARLRERRDRVPYMQWIRDGLIEATPGEVVDYDWVRTKINELGETVDIQGIAIDRWNATQLATQLAGDGFEVAAFGQGFASMSAPTKRLEELVLSKQLVHGGNPVLRWMANNVAVEQDAAGNLKPSKKRSRERIDGIVALIMSLGIAGQAKPEQPSVYSTRGVLVVGDYEDDETLYRRGTEASRLSGSHQAGPQNCKAPAQNCQQPRQSCGREAARRGHDHTNAPQCRRDSG